MTGGSRPDGDSEPAPPVGPVSSRLAGKPGVGAEPAGPGEGADTVSSQRSDGRIDLVIHEPAIGSPVVMSDAGGYPTDGVTIATAIPRGV